MPRALAALALLLLAAHLLLLPETLGDIDSVNFALGVREFDVAQHQPHPPGYPVFIALSKASTAVFEWAGAGGPEARGLAFWSAISAAALLPLLFLLFRSLDESRRTAAWSAAVTVTAPVLWFTAIRPLSDLTGLAAGVAAQVLLLHAWADPARTRTLAAGALVAGLAIGVRSQTFLLTLPLLAVLLVRVRARSPGTILRALGALAVGVLIWAIPLVVASGGVRAYLAALGQQGSEDFTGVVMFWNFPTVRVAAAALYNTFLAPWASPWLAAIVLCAAAIGVLTLRQQPRTAFLAGMLALPYLLFHLVFQETATVRYALPTLPVIAWLAMRGVGRVAPRALPVFGAGVAACSLIPAVPAAIAYARVPPPVYRAIHDLAEAQQVDPVTVATHRRVFAESRRIRQWLQEATGTWLPSPPGYEWLQLTAAWRAGTASAAWFLADPARTDLALLDMNGVQLTRYRWPFDGSVFAGGSRPDEFDGYAFARPPGWFLEDGWALTPEVAGITFRDGKGPHRQGSVGWIRRRSEEADMVLGGRHLGPGESPAVRLTATIDGRTVLDRSIEPGFFVDRVALPAGLLEGPGRFAALLVKATALDGSSQAVSLEQFDLQNTGVPMVAFADGWHEPEQQRGSATEWRWMSPRARLWVRPVGRDVTLTMIAESPLRYFDDPPELRVSLTDTALARLSPSDDFTWTVVLPGERLAQAAGDVWIESNRHFVPGEGIPGGDQRQLALRVYAIRVN